MWDKPEPFQTPTKQMLKKKKQQIAKTHVLSDLACSLFSNCPLDCTLWLMERFGAERAGGRVLYGPVPQK